MVAANAAGRLAPGQREMLLGGPIRPPVAGPVLIGLGLVTGGMLALAGRVGPGVGTFLVVMGLGLAVMGMNLDTRRRRRRLRSDLAAAQIGSGPGEVVGDGQDSVEIRTGLDLIDLGLGAPAPPEPGVYHLYWLEHPHAQRWNSTRVLLSARPTPASRQGHTAASGPVLLLALGITEADLRDNRAGVLSPPQRRMLARSLRRRILACVLAILLGAGCVAGSVVELSGLRPSSPSEDTIGALLPAIGGSLVLLVVGFLVPRLRRTAATLRLPAPVAHASGPVTLRRVSLESDDQLDWHLALDQLTFPVATIVARAFFEPVRYTLYYLPAGPTLLSAEPLDRPDSAD